MLIAISPLKKVYDNYVLLKFQDQLWPKIGGTSRGGEDIDYTNDLQEII